MQSIEQKVQKIISDYAGNKPVTVSTHLEMDLGLDSLDLFELATDIEVEFGVEITDEETRGFFTVGNIVEAVFLKVEKKKESAVNK